MELAYITSTIQRIQPGSGCCIVDLLFVELNLGTIQLAVNNKILGYPHLGSDCQFQKDTIYLGRCTLGPRESSQLSALPLRFPVTGLTASEQA